ncbi:MAG: alanine--tRNA ligase-related protein, partial [Planctomycetota bacterium]
MPRVEPPARTATAATSFTDDAAKHDPKPLVATVEAIWTGSHLEASAAGGEVVGVILDRTCCYAESGGQVGDTGMLRVARNGDDEHGVLEILDTLRCGGYVLHRARVERGHVRTGDRAEVSIEHRRRGMIAANHTGTHLLNLALRRVAGEDSDQRGSLVAPDRLRFDYAGSKALSLDDLAEIDRIVGEAVAADLSVHAGEAPLDAAKSIRGLRAVFGERFRGLRAVFGERYPDPVRVVSIGAPVERLVEHPEDERWALQSTEFCGGTHVAKTGEIGRFAVVSEQALAAGVRRVFAVTGVAAEAAAKAAQALDARFDAAASLHEEALLEETASISNELEGMTLGALEKARLLGRLDVLREQAKQARKKMSASFRDAAIGVARGLLEEQTGPCVVGFLGEGDRDALLGALDVVRAARPDGAALLVAQPSGEEKL